MSPALIVAWLVLALFSLVLTAHLAHKKGYSRAWALLALVFGVLTIFGFLFLPNRLQTRLITPEQQRASIRVIPPDEHGRYHR
jgi:Na+/melibiose symporter-like transporter